MIHRLNGVQLIVIAGIFFGAPLTPAPASVREAGKTSKLEALGEANPVKPANPPDTRQVAEPTPALEAAGQEKVSIPAAGAQREGSLDDLDARAANPCSPAALPGEEFDRLQCEPETRQVRSSNSPDPEASSSATLRVPSRWDRGMNFVGFDRSAFSVGARNGSVNAAKKQLGIKTAIFVPHWYTRTAGSSRISRTFKTPTDSGLKAIARHARNRLGMKVVIKPHIDSLDETWRGQLEFPNRNAFWKDYNRIILRYADIADDVNAHGLVIGTELSKVQDDQPDKWRKLIGKVRNRFDGLVYYAANWDTVLSVDSIPDWFGLLDVIGIDYYCDNSNRSAQQMWKNIEDIRERFGNDIVLSESGGDSRGNQERQYSTIHDAMLPGRDKPWFRGIWWYNRFTFAKGGYGKTWNEFTPNKETSKWLCRKQTKKSSGKCGKLIERAWK